MKIEPFFFFLHALYFIIFVSACLIFWLILYSSHCFSSSTRWIINICLIFRQKLPSHSVYCVCGTHFYIFPPLVLNSKIIINPDCVGLSAVLFFTRCIFFPWRLCGKLREFYNRISICCISDSVFGATIFHPRIDKLFPGEVWISPFLSLSLSFPDVSLQLPWLTANSFITGHKHQVLHLKGHPTPNSRTSEKSTCKNSIQGTLFH